MYEAFFGLTKRPFASVPSVDQYFPGETIEAARQTLARCIRRAEGPAMVIGPAGTGKTMLCHMLANDFASQFQVVLVTGQGLVTRRALLQAILYGLGRPYRRMDEGELRLGLVDYLTTAEMSPAGMLLLVDEAHALSLRLLDEIRVLGHVVCGGEPRVRIILAGGPPLEERLASPKLESLSQALAARCYLEALNRQQTEEYIQAQITGAGGRPGEIFPPDACQSVYQATDGVPRLVNHVCDHVLLLAYAAGKRVIRPEHVEEAWADLQQLPTPWNGDAETKSAGGNVVEFGGLDDEAETSDKPAESLQTSRLPPEPTEQIEEIETLIGHMQEPVDFEPAAPQKPEVEMIIEDFGDPFSELFAEEEIVVDRRPARDNGFEPESIGHPATALDDECEAAAIGRAAAPLDDECEAAALGRAAAQLDDECEAAAIGRAAAPFDEECKAEAIGRAADACTDDRAESRPASRGRQPRYSRLFSRLKREATVR